MVIQLKRFSRIAASVAWLFASGCASHSSKREVPLQAAASIPAAEGRVKAELTKNDNTSIQIEVKHMAQPDRVNAGATTYVVWTRQTAQAHPQNVGSLKVDKNLNGSLKTVTPLKNFEVFITSEATNEGTEPTGQPLMTARIDLN